MMTEHFDDRKARASVWFRQLRDDIVAAFEAIEDSQTDGPLADMTPGRFDVSETKRASDDGSDAGGGLMSVMRGGRVFEKVGVNVSTVFGTLGDRAQAAMADWVGAVQARADAVTGLEAVSAALDSAN